MFPLEQAALPWDWTIRWGDWVRVENDAIVDVNPGRSGNAKFRGCRVSVYGTTYSYFREIHGSYNIVCRCYGMPIYCYVQMEADLDKEEAPNLGAS